MLIERSCVLAVTLYVSAVFSVSVFAEDAPAYGRLNATIGCDSNVNGLTVSFIDRVVESNPLIAPPALGVELGDDCLESLAQFPGFVRLATVLEEKPPAVDIPDCLIWIIDGSNVSSHVDVPGLGKYSIRTRRAAVCDVNSSGGLDTVFVSGTDYLPQYGEVCGTTRRNLLIDGSPIAATLSNDGTQPLGGLLFTGVGPNAMEVLTCNVNTSGDDLEVSYFANQDGVGDGSLVGESCLATVSAREAAIGGLKFGPPTALPAGTDTSDPGCLIWVVAGGTVLEPW